jgi:hypothetical protein
MFELKIPSVDICRQLAQALSCRLLTVGGLSLCPGQSM